MEGLVSYNVGAWRMMPAVPTENDKLFQIYLVGEPILSEYSIAISAGNEDIPTVVQKITNG